MILNDILHKCLIFSLSFANALFNIVINSPPIKFKMREKFVIVLKYFQLNQQYLENNIIYVLKSKKYWIMWKK